MCRCSCLLQFVKDNLVIRAENLALAQCKSLGITQGPSYLLQTVSVSYVFLLSPCIASIQLWGAPSLSGWYRHYISLLIAPLSSTNSCTCIQHTHMYVNTFWQRGTGSKLCSLDWAPRYCHIRNQETTKTGLALGHFFKNKLWCVDYGPKKLMQLPWRKP